MFSDPDRGLPFVDEATYAVALGGSTSTESYLDADKVLDAVPDAGDKFYIVDSLDKAREAAEQGREFYSRQRDAVAGAIDRGRERYAADPKLVEYFTSDRGRSFIRSSLRRSRVVERLIDAWLEEVHGGSTR